jgi:hypothetical protein
MSIPRDIIKLILKNNKSFGDIIKPRSGPPPKIKKWVKKYENEIIENIVICRHPVNGAVMKLINIISIGKFDKSLKGLHYDDLFHLYMYITIKGKTWRLEKNEVVTLTLDNRQAKEDCLDLDEKRIKLGDYMKTGEKYQKDFWNYNARNNNCQDFAISLLVGNKIIKKNSRVYKFVKQDAEEIFRNNPEYLTRFGKKVTDIAGIFDILKNGFK